MDNVKTLVIYGDSISALTCGRGGYHMILKEMLGNPVLYNHAISASALTRNTYLSTSELLENSENIHADADVVILWHGTNDWYWGAEVGNRFSESDLTYCGAIRNAVNKIRDAAPLCKIIMPTPLFRLQAPDCCHYVREAYDNPNKRGYTQKDYYDAVMDMSEEMCFSVVDLRRLTNFSRQSMTVYQPDGIHPSEAGCEVVASLIYKHILSL